MRESAHVWIVEMWNAERQRFEPTVGIGLCRLDGRTALQRWKTHNRADSFRLRKYIVKGAK